MKAVREDAVTPLEKKQMLLAAVVESSHDAIISKTLDGRITSWNKGAQRLFGYTAEEAVGQLIHMLIPHDRQDEERFIINRLKKGEYIEHYETIRRRKDGSHVDISLTLSPMRDSNGHIIGASKVAREITEKKRLEKELQQAVEKAQAADSAKSEFLAIMSHEIRTPMNAVVGLANILHLSEPLTFKQKEYIQTLQLSADSLLSLINDLLDISKIETRTIELEHISFSLTQLIAEVTSILSVRLQEKSLTLTSNADILGNRLFYGDPTRLRQIILNICGNAVKFTERGGIHITIDTTPADAPGTEMVRIAIADTGIGIAADKIEHIFDKFVQADASISRKFGGSGLGLAITKTLIEIMSGSIEVQSMPGKGSVFTLCLPLQISSELPSSTAPVEAKINQHLAGGSERRVLLVEDYEANILVATTFLEFFGFSYDLAKNGSEAVEKATHTDYIAILMDVQMYGMNGFEATTLIRAHEKQEGKKPVLIIGMTAHALAGDRERCLECGMNDYIAKPFNPEVLRKKLAAVAEAMLPA